MVNIYIVDYIGIHCGMHYYLEAFKIALENIPDVSIRILSNYSDCNQSAFFLNQYKGNIFVKGLNLLNNLVRLHRFVLRHKKDILIYLSYGNSIDIPFIKIVTKCPNHVIDIHEAIAQDVDANKNLKRKFKSLYSRIIKRVISHSSRTDEFLKEYEFKGRRFFVPHFKYVFKKNYDESLISNEIKKSIERDKINLLFFGNLNESKGVDILIDSINKLPEDIANRLNVIIAGKDFDGSVNRFPIKYEHIVRIFKRHISDDELRFLYQRVDYLTLPYRKTSQSGILEMAFYFKRPILASNIPYFNKTLQEFPSFGILAGGDSQSYANTIKSVISNHKQTCFFTDDDYARYENRKEINLFISVFYNWIKEICHSE